MLKIAMCDSNELFLNDLMQITKNLFYQISSDLDIEVTQYLNGSNLINDIFNGYCYDLITLEWLMPTLDGESTAQAIRRVDQNCLIIFITAFTDYALRATRLTTFRYITKDHLQTDLAEALQAAYNKILETDKKISIKTSQNNLMNLKILEIFYIEHRMGENKIRTKSNMYFTRRRSFLQEIEATLTENGFTKPYRGILVNVREIREVLQTELVLSNGDRIPISRRYKRAVKLALRHRTNSFYDRSN